MTDLVAAVLTRPTFAIEEATAFLAQSWGIHGNLRPLPSERDRNFAVADPDRAGLLARWQRRLAHLRGAMPNLRQSVIHNDANDNNVLVSEDGESISGLLDLGDAVHSITVNELAVAAAYAALDAPDP